MSTARHVQIGQESIRKLVQRILDDERWHMTDDTIQWLEQIIREAQMLEDSTALMLADYDLRDILERQ